MVLHDGTLELHDETRDGLRVFHVDSGRQTTRASLCFRVGMADETLATCGWTHLLEHLALHEWSDPRIAFNASVGLYLTRFDLDGETAVVHEHLERLGRWLGDPDLSHLEHEAKVLRAESEQRPGAAIVSGLEWRFGAAGPGLVAYREVGLSRASAEPLRAWAAQVFTSGNAALATDTPLPDGFSHGLPEGPMRRVGPTPAATTTIPGRHPLVGGGVVGSAVVTRSDAAALATEVLSRTLTERFRTASGTAYAPWANYERVDADTALLTFGSDISSDGRETAADVVVAAVDALARSGPPPEMLEEMTVSRERQLNDPVNAPGVAWGAALSWLSDGPVRTFAEGAEASRAVTPEEVASVFDQVRRTLVLGMPQEGLAPLSLREIRHPVVTIDRAVETFRHVDGVTAIHVTDAGIELVAPEPVVTTRWADVAGMLTYPDGARIVVSRAGWQVVVEPTLLRRGDRLVAFVDRHVPKELVLPQPPRPREHVPARPSWTWRARRRWSVGARSARSSLAGSSVLYWGIWAVVVFGAQALYHYLSGR